jgi:hypothetical protein
MLTVLMGMAAFATDLGWLLLSTSRLQKAADAAALAGVVNLPGFMTQAQSDASGAASANGFPIGGSTSIGLTQLDDNRLQVDLSTRVQTFFLRALGINGFDITRRSTAEYIKPVPLGSPNNCFGKPVGVSGCPDPNLWGAISGPFTSKTNGDAYATRCVTATSSSCSPTNSQYRPAGYYYAVEVFPGTTGLSVQIYDAGFYERGDFNVETGDREQDRNGGTDTLYQFYNVDVTPLDPTDNPPVAGCGWTIGSNSGASTYKNQWRTLCSLGGSLTPGVYVLRVWTSGNIGGTNQYSVRATTSSGPAPRLYGINDISIFTNQPSSTADLYLAEVAQVHAGKKLELKFYDPGEDDQPAWMTVKRPDGTTPNCDWTATNESGSVTASGSGSCSIQTSNSSGPLFNGQWITAVVDIPDTYTCSTNCWWKMQIQLSQPHDRTVWEVRVIGNPVRLTENEP